MLAVTGDAIILSILPVLLAALIGVLGKIWIRQTKADNVLESLSKNVLPWFQEPPPGSDHLSLPAQTRKNEEAVKQLQEELHTHMMNEEESNVADARDRSSRQQEMDTFRRKTTRDIRKIKKALGITIYQQEK